MDRQNAQKGDKITVQIRRYQYVSTDFYLVEGEVTHATKTRLKVVFTTEKGYKQQEVFTRKDGLVYPYNSSSYYRLQMEKA